MAGGMSTTPPSNASFRAALLLWIGAVASFLGWMIWGGPSTPWLSITLFALSVPWFVHAFAVKRNTTRTVGLLGGAGLAIVLDYLLVIWAALPAYAGPATVGTKVPAFAVGGADGQVRRAADLLGQRTLLIFFRGKW